MIGFDRPIRPQWIHESLLLWRADTPLRDFHESFNQIAHELSGREGKRKVRTVLFRYFFDFSGHAPNQITSKQSLLSTIAANSTLDELKPTYLIILIDRATVLQEILSSLMRLFSFGKQIITKQLVDNIVELHGERDVVQRSARSFLMTLVFFGILKKKGINYEWNEKMTCSPKALAYALLFFSLDNGRVEVDIRELRQDSRFSLINLENLEDCVRQYNGVLWSYIRRPLTAKFMIHQDASEKVVQI